MAGPDTHNLVLKLNELIRTDAWIRDWHLDLSPFHLLLLIIITVIVRGPHPLIQWTHGAHAMAPMWAASWEAPHRTHLACWGCMDKAYAVTRRPRERLDPPVVGGTGASASEVEG